jgi:hypothetical protein
LDDISDMPDAPIVFNQTHSVASLAALLRHTYFTRLWKVPEVLLARAMHVLVGRPLRGSIWVSGEEMCMAARRSESALRILNVPNPALVLLRDHGTNTKHSLAITIANFSRGQCADVRDKIFGLLGLIEDHERLAVDYRKSITDLFLDAVRAFVAAYIKQQHNLQSSVSALFTSVNG